MSLMRKTVVGELPAPKPHNVDTAYGWLPRTDEGVGECLYYTAAALHHSVGTNLNKLVHEGGTTENGEVFYCTSPATLGGVAEYDVVLGARSRGLRGCRS